MTLVSTARTTPRRDTPLLRIVVTDANVLINLMHVSRLEHAEWEQEIQRRLQSVKDGTAALHGHDDVMRELDEIVRRCCGFTGRRKRGSRPPSPPTATEPRTPSSARLHGRAWRAPPKRVSFSTAFLCRAIVCGHAVCRQARHRSRSRQIELRFTNGDGELCYWNGFDPFMKRVPTLARIYRPEPVQPEIRDRNVHRLRRRRAVGVFEFEPEATPVSCHQQVELGARVGAIEIRIATSIHQVHRIFERESLPRGAELGMGEHVETISTAEQIVQ